jgi:hypothetical protein
MLCLKQCIDMCDLTPQEASTLAERASLPEIVAAQGRCPRAEPAAATQDDEGDVRCVLLDRLHAADDFRDLRRVAQQYRAFSLARAATGA